MSKTDKVNIVLGTIPEFVKPETYTQAIDEKGLLCQVQEISRDKNNAYVATYIHESDMQQPMHYLKSIDFNILNMIFPVFPVG